MEFLNSQYVVWTANQRPEYARNHITIRHGWLHQKYANLSLIYNNGLTDTSHLYLPNPLSSIGVARLAIDLDAIRSGLGM